MIEITSFSNKKIKDLIKLKKRGDRKDRNLFFIEGYKEILFASKSFEIVELFFCEELFLKDNELELIKKIESKNSLIIKCPKKIFEKISYRDRPDGLIAVAKQKNRDFKELETIVSNKKNPIFMVCVGIEKPGNLGSILRTSDCALVDALIVADSVTDIYNPNVVRSSRGSLFTIPIFEEKSAVLISFFKKRKISIAATTPHCDNLYTKQNLKGPIAIVVGPEQYGLDDFWLKNADCKLKIPMMGKSDSLNVSVSAALVLYEAIRQRDV